MAFRPQTFANVEDPQELRRYLLELQQELARALGETNQLSPVVTSATYAANYDEIVRIDPPTGGTTVILPPPSIAKAGATVTLTVVGDGGQVTLECVGGQVNNSSTFTFQAGVGDVVCRLDGPRGWFIPSAELSSSGPADAQYYVGAADGSLPNARLGTASSHITPDQGTANQVSWDFTDGNSSAYESWVWNDTAWSLQAASNPREVLRLNDVGTAIGYGDPVEVRERGTDVGDAYALDVVNGPGMTGHASVASRVGALQFCLAAHRIKTESATGIIDTSDWNDYDAIYFTGAQPEVQNIPQPTDPDGNAYEKVLWLLGSTVVAPLTIRHNTGTGTGRIFCPNLRDSEQFQLSSSQLVYNTVENRWFIVANTSVVAEANNDGTLLIGRSLNFMNAPAGLTWTLAKAAGEIRITPTLANIPLTALADQADDTGLRNISGSPAPPTASALSSWVDGNKLTYNSTSHYWQWEGMEGRIGGADAGDFVGIDFTNGSGNVTFSLASGAGGTFGVVANVDLSGVTYTAGDGLDLSGQQFSVDVSDFAGTGLEDDGANNLRVKWENSRTLAPGSGSGSIAILDTDEHVRLDPTGTFTVTGITGGYPGQVVFLNMTTGGGDTIVWTDVTGVDTPNGANVTQNAGDLVMLFKSSSGETDWYVCPLYPFTEVHSWSDVLASGNNTGSNDPHVDSGRFIGFGTEGATVGSGNLRSSGSFRISADGAIFLDPAVGSGLHLGDHYIQLSEITEPTSVSDTLVQLYVRENTVDSELAYIAQDDEPRDIATLPRRGHIPYFEQDNFSCFRYDSSNEFLFSDTTWKVERDPNGGTITQIGSVRNHHGIVRLTTAGVATDDFVRIFKGNAESDNVVFFNDVERVIFVIRPQTNTSCRWTCSVTDSMSTTMSRGARFAQDSASGIAGTSNLVFQTRDGSTTQETDVGVAISNAWTVLEIVRNSNGSWSGYVDGSLVATHTTNVPDSLDAGFIGNVGIVIVQSSTTSRYLEKDYFSIKHAHNSRQS